MLGDWEAPYTTMAPEYEAAQLGVLQAMLRRGLLFRGERPVHWSPASRTALAEAELEYADRHVSTAAHVAFPLLEGPPAAAAAADFDPFDGGSALEGAAVVVWTTTPWTIPANQAVCVREDLTYAVVEASDVQPSQLPSEPALPAAAEVEERVRAQGEVVRAAKAALKEGRGSKAEVEAGVAALLRLKSELQSGKPELQPGDSPPNLNASPLPHGARLVVAASLVDALSEAVGTPLVVAATLPGAALIGRHCAHPLSARPVPVLHAEHVTDDAGTGLVHTAPGHGPEDFAVGVAHGLAAACPVDEKGCFTAATEEAAGFAGESVLYDGNEAVLTALREGGSLLAAARHEHRYPYDWRSKTPVIFRTTPQWFVRLGDLRGEALAALHAVEMRPPAGRARLEACVRGRTEWCPLRMDCPTTQFNLGVCARPDGVVPFSAAVVGRAAPGLLPRGDGRSAAHRGEGGARGACWSVHVVVSDEWRLLRRRWSTWRRSCRRTGATAESSLMAESSLTPMRSQ